MAQVQLFKFQTSKNKGKQALHWILECILPCLLGFVITDYIGYYIIMIITESMQIKGIDLHTTFDEQIPLLTPFILFYTPAWFTWIIMPFVVYGVYGRDRFWHYFTANIVLTALYFISYLLIPTQAYLQYDQVMNHGMYVNNPNLNFFGKMLAKTYQQAAPYGELPSGHSLNSFIFIFAVWGVKSQTDKKYGKVQYTVAIIWTIYAILVVMATFFLKQHNFVDWIYSLFLILVIWFSFKGTKFIKIVHRLFITLNVKLGICPPTKEISQISYDKNHSWKYYLKISLLWIGFLLVIAYLLMIAWNITLGGFFHMKLPNWLIPSYTTPTYSDDGKMLLPGYDFWPTMY